LTFTWKLVDEEEAPREFQTNIVQFLSRHKFDITKRIAAGIPVIDATAGECQMIVVEAAPDGWMRDFIHHALGLNEHQFTVFRGRIYTKQPAWLTLADHWWWRSLRKLGLARRESPIIAVSATESCDAKRLPWDELSRSKIEVNEPATHLSRRTPHQVPPSWEA